MQEAQRFYDGIANSFDDRWKRYHACTHKLTHALLDALDATPKHVLDIGCGTGAIISILQEHFPSAAMTGIDPSRGMLNQARKKVPRARFLEGDIFAPLQESFDLITAVSMFHYIDNPQAWLDRAARLLNEQGTLLLIDWNSSAPLMNIRKRRLQKLPHIKHVYTEDEMKHLLIGWQHIEQTKRSCGAGWWSMQGYLVRKHSKSCE